MLVLVSVSTSWSLRRSWDNEHTRVLGRGRGGGAMGCRIPVSGNRAIGYARLALLCCDSKLQSACPLGKVSLFG